MLLYCIFCFSCSGLGTKYCAQHHWFRIGSWFFYCTRRRNLPILRLRFFTNPNSYGTNW